MKGVTGEDTEITGDAGGNDGDARNIRRVSNE